MSFPVERRKEERMKRKLFLMPVLGLSLVLGTCIQAGAFPGQEEKEGIGPYELSQDQSELLQAFGMEQTSRIFSFAAPEEAITVKVHVYQLNEDGTWKVMGGGVLSIGTEREPVDRLAGTIAIERLEDYSIDFTINCAGSGSFASEPVELEKDEEKPFVSTWTYLEERQDIQMDTEIPLAFMVYDDGNSLKSCSLEEYFDPSPYEGMELVQAVTVEFSDKELGSGT